jgi:hypothetical protein
MIKARMRNPAVPEPNPVVSPPVPPTKDLTTGVSQPRPKPHVTMPDAKTLESWGVGSFWSEPVSPTGEFSIPKGALLNFPKPKEAT